MTNPSSAVLVSARELDVFWRTDGEYFPSRISEISRTDAFIKTPNPPEVGTTVGLRLGEPGSEVWLAAVVRRAWLDSNRRKSQRVLVSIPVQVVAKNPYGTEIFEDTKTISINARGALLPLQMEVNKGQTITLRNPATQEALECSVDYLGDVQEGHRQVGVSFVQPDRSLWQIAFPPSDWSPHHPQAKAGSQVASTRAEICD